MSGYVDGYKGLVNPGAYENIKKLCTERDYKCLGCRYSYRYIVKKEDPNYQWNACCIFGDMPRDWRD